jgi:hypothetical protein
MAADAQAKGALRTATPPASANLRLAYSWELSDPMVGLGLDVSEADEPGGDELCSLAPADSSALPEEGSMAL